MAERLTDAFGPEVPRRIAAMVRRVHPAFEEDAFVADALRGFSPLPLTRRARLVARALARHLPDDYARALAVLVASLGPPLGDPDRETFGMAPFMYLPHVMFIEEHGLADVDASLGAQHALTQRLSCELSIRPFLEAHPERTLSVLAAWTRDPSPHVRRLVSEGTRPRLPWAPRLRSIAADPGPILPLLAALRDDPTEYVRRSVANNLNDISKDHPDLVVALLAEWLDAGPPTRLRLARHALRTLRKAGDPAALALLGVRADARLRLARVELSPPRPRIGYRLRVDVEVVNDGDETALAAAYLRVHFATAAGSTSARTFAAGEAELAPGGRARLGAGISLRQHTTRTHHPGQHRIEVLVNGRRLAEQAFALGPGRAVRAPG